MNRLINPKNKLFVFDMAGTVINEGGLVYKTLYETLKNFHIQIDEKEIKYWHGANKYDVLNHFLKRSFVKNFREGASFLIGKYELSQAELAEYNVLKPTLHHMFNKNLKDIYFSNNSVKFIDEKLPTLFCKIRENNIKIALNTGYSKEIQEAIIHNLHLKELIDDYISSDVVQEGRPSPFMINALIRRNDIASPEMVIKFGDTRNDILEGINARCGESIGVLTGASEKKIFEEANATRILDSVMKIC